MMHPHADITVVVCTRNRALRLARMLASLEESYRAAGAATPVLVVDNGSTDDTTKIVRDFASRLPLRSVRHDVTGLSAARNRALAECRADLLWFLDDDVTVSPGWFTAARAAAAVQLDADWFGGPVQPLWEVPRPAWFGGDDDRFRGMFVWYDPGGPDRPLTSAMPCFFGANIGFRRRVFTDGLRFNEQLGKIGDRPRLGEDVALQHALTRLGRRGYYVAHATVAHPVDLDRTRLRYLAAWHVESGRAMVEQAASTIIASRWLAAPRYLYRRTLEIGAAGAARLLCGVMTLSSSRAAVGLSDLCRAVGMFRQLIARARTASPADRSCTTESVLPATCLTGVAHR